jgi:hypothetical protein
MEKANSMDKNTAKIFQEMRSADALKSDMKANIDKGKDDSAIGRAIGSAYDSLVGALQDIHRRLIEKPWWGKDVFDGRWTVDTKGPQDMQGMDRNYDTRASFYGWDKQNPSQDQGKEKSQDHGTDESQGLSQSRGR